MSRSWGASSGPATESRARHPGHFRSRGAGWEYVHVCVDDCTRIAYVELLADERPETAVGFLRRALGFFSGHGVTVERLMTDNGNPYRSRLHAAACRELGIRHPRTEAYRPRTNGKAERFIRTLLAGRGLPPQRRTDGRARPLPRLLQPSPPTPRNRRSSASRQTLPADEPG
jgi:transposase InsO family protein